MEIALGEVDWEVRSMGAGNYVAVHGSGRVHELDADDYVAALYEACKRFAREQMDELGGD